jgi:hypothetical protein
MPLVLFGLWLVLAALILSWLFRATVNKIAIFCVELVWSAIGWEGTPAVMQGWEFWAVTAVLAGLIYIVYRIGLWVAGIRSPKVYTSRRKLEDGKRGGAYPLDEAETAHCVWLSGGKTFNADSDLKKIKKLILPNPNASSTRNFQKANKAGTDFCNMILTTTRVARERNIPIRWYPEFIGTSWWIADRDKESAFVHFELILPESTGRDRPSFRIYRWQDEDAYDEHCRIFDELWDASKPLSDSDLSPRGPDQPDNDGQGGTKPSAPKKVERDVWVLNAIHFIAFGSWEIEDRALASGQGLELVPIMRALEQAALDGKVPIWGKQPPRNKFVSIEPAIWEHLQIREQSVFSGNPARVYARRIYGNVLPARYDELMTSKIKIEEWHAENTYP